MRAGKQHQRVAVGWRFRERVVREQPGAAGLFSTTTGWPRRSESFCPRRRLTRSLPEPEASRPGNASAGGYCCAIASPEASAASAASIATGKFDVHFASVERERKGPNTIGE